MCLGQFVMIYKHNILVLKKLVDEICYKCIQSYGADLNQPCACVFEDICRWCHWKFLFICEKMEIASSGNYARLDDVVNYTYNGHWIYGEGFLEAEDINLVNRKNGLEKMKKSKLSDLCVFKTILYILDTEKSALKVKEKIEEFLYLDRV